MKVANGQRIKKSNGKKLSKKTICLSKLISKIKNELSTKKISDLSSALSVGRKVAKNFKNVSTKRVIPIPKKGGFLPALIPIFAALSALGGITGGVSKVVDTINQAKNAKRQLEEAQRHNERMEAIAVGGKGLYLRPYKKGLGLYLRQSRTNRYQ